MSILGKIFGKIFRQEAERPHDAAPTGRSPQFDPGTRSSGGGAPSQQSQVDVEARLDEMKAAASQDLDWRHSIVDLMKLVGMDSSLSERRELADELGYQGDKGDTATMNMWLHKQVMKKLEENGGRVPPDLLD